MGDYKDGKKDIVIMPVPGRPYPNPPPPPPPQKQQEANVSQNVNVGEDAINAIANAVIDAIGKKKVVSRTEVEDKVDEYDPQASLEKLADAMVVQRDDSKSNFDDLGDVKETKKDTDEVDKTIDLLSKLDKES